MRQQCALYIRLVAFCYFIRPLMLIGNIHSEFIAFAYTPGAVAIHTRAYQTVAFFSLSQYLSLSDILFVCHLYLLHYIFYMLYTDAIADMRFDTGIVHRLATLSSFNTACLKCMAIEEREKEREDVLKTYETNWCSLLISMFNQARYKSVCGICARKKTRFYYNKPNNDANHFLFYVSVQCVLLSTWLSSLISKCTFIASTTRTTRS